MKKLINILEPSITNELRFTDTNVEVWTKSYNLKIEDLENEKIKYNNLLQVLDSLEEDYTTLIILIKICKSCAIVDARGQPIPASDIKFNLLKSITEEYGARNYLLIEHTKEVEKLKLIEKLPKEVIKEELVNGQGKVK